MKSLKTLKNSAFVGISSLVLALGLFAAPAAFANGNGRGGEHRGDRGDHRENRGDRREGDREWRWNRGERHEGDRDGFRWTNEGRHEGERGDWRNGWGDMDRD